MGEVKARDGRGESERREERRRETGGEKARDGRREGEKREEKGGGKIPYQGSTKVFQYETPLHYGI